MVTAEYQRCYILSIWFLQLIYLFEARGIGRLSFFHKRNVAKGNNEARVPGAGTRHDSKCGMLNFANEIVEGILLAKSEFLAKAVSGGVYGGRGDGEHPGNLLGAHAYAQVRA